MEARRRGEPMDSGGVVASPPVTVSSRLLGPCGTRPLPSPLVGAVVLPGLVFSSVGLMISTECLLREVCFEIAINCFTKNINHYYW